MSDAMFMSRSATKPDSYPATWLSRSEPHLCYRVMPKCGCSSIGQVLHLLDHGKFYTGEIHSAQAPILKWQTEAGQREICRIMKSKSAFRFTTVRNPYRRLLSSFADKVFGYQANGQRYRGGTIQAAVAAYGVKWGPKSHIVDNFRAFLRFAADTIENKQPMEPDLHWVPCYTHLDFTKYHAPDWSLDYVAHIETISKDLTTIAEMTGIDPSRIPAKIPRENSTSVPPLPMTSYYGEEERKIMRRVFGPDFELFGYNANDPSDSKPRGPVDVAAVNEALKAHLSAR